jgi:hypothetical protein
VQTLAEKPQELDPEPDSPLAKTTAVCLVNILERHPSKKVALCIPRMFAPVKDEKMPQFTEKGKNREFGGCRKTTNCYTIDVKQRIS